MALLSLLSNLTRGNDDLRRTESYRNVIRQEAKIGGRLFGAVAPGGRREFFCLNESTWVWHEEWVDAQGAVHAMTTRYDVRPNGILKAQDNMPYQYIGLEEAKRFYQAVKMYRNQVNTELYNLAA